MKYFFFLGAFLIICLSSIKSLADVTSEPLPDDNFLTFLDKQTYINNIFLLNDHNLTQGKTSFNLWAGAYWPVHQGVLGARYADSEFPKSKVFIENYDYYLLHPSEMLLITNSLNLLSPSEKYDLLVGDSNWTLTKAMWQKGKTEYENYGFVPTWTGICHGWAAAVHMGAKAPLRSVWVTDVTGNYRIEFTKQDIKSLASYIWAESNAESLKAGNRCRQSSVLKDPYQRPIDPSCLDSNPMSWHLAITNRLGVYKKSFVMDSTYNNEVWNYPVAGYDYSYFNPRTFESSHSLKASLVPINNLFTDKYKKYRSSKAKYLVGVAMDVFYPSMAIARAADIKNDASLSSSFIYDLELDENYTIVGGEWYSQNRPDFIWTFPLGTRALTREDMPLSRPWNTNMALPMEYAEKALQASSRGKVLSKIAGALEAASTDLIDTSIDPH